MTWPLSARTMSTGCSGGAACACGFTIDTDGCDAATSQVLYLIQAMLHSNTDREREIDGVLSITHLPTEDSSKH